MAGGWGSGSWGVGEDMVMGGLGLFWGRCGVDSVVVMVMVSWSGGG